MKKHLVALLLVLVLSIYGSAAFAMEHPTFSVHSFTFGEEWAEQAEGRDWTSPLLLVGEWSVFDDETALTSMGLVFEQGAFGLGLFQPNPDGELKCVFLTNDCFQYIGTDESVVYYHSKNDSIRRYDLIKKEYLPDIPDVKWFKHICGFFLIYTSIDGSECSFPYGVGD